MAFFSNKKSIIALFTAFLVFGILAGVDFYRWNYEYGHNLDPNAAIQVPGMAYQPPLIGYKQLLNFGAFSMPDSGGWMLISCGLLLCVAVLKETNLIKRIKKPAALAMMLVLAVSTISCSGSASIPIKLNVDHCEFCKMTISDGKFGTELLTQKGRHYKFDDLSCMSKYVNENTQTKYKAFFVSDYLKENVLIPAEHSFYLRGGTISSPMRGNTAAFATMKQAAEFKEKLNAEVSAWSEVIKIN